MPGSNKFRGTRVTMPQAQPLAQEPQIGFGGFRSDVPTHKIPLDAAARLDHLRVDQGALRKDFGWQTLGTAAPLKILGLFEHKFIYDQLTYSRVVRIFRQVDGTPKLQVWSGTSWLDTATSTQQMEDVMLSMVSTLGSLLMADGKRILRWGEDTTLDEQADDFPAANSLTAAGQTTQLSVEPAGAYSDSYNLHYDVELAGNTDISVVLKFYHNDFELGEARYDVLAAQMPESFMNEVFSFSRLIADGDTVKIKLDSISAGAGSRTQISDDFAAGGTPRFQATKSVATRSWDDTYQYNFEYDATDGPLVVEVWLNPNGGGWEKLTDLLINDGRAGVYRYDVHREGLGAGTLFGLDLPGSLQPGFIPLNVTWEWENVTASTADVHGMNKVTDGDPNSGLEYQTMGAVISVFDLLSLDAPKARYIFPFGDRLLALQDDGDKQSLCVCADGDLFTWTGVDTDQMWLVDGQSDPLDDVMAGAAVADNMFALYRKRSIMRGFETYNPQHPIGVTKWIEGIGTSSPFSIRIVPGGNIFLGHDRMPYYLQAQQSPVPIGGPIWQELVRSLTTNLHMVESAWDSVLEEYWLGIPELGADHITAWWVFSFGLFLQQQGIVWRRRPIDARRIAAVSAI